MYDSREASKKKKKRKKNYVAACVLANELKQLYIDVHMAALQNGTHEANPNMPRRNPDCELLCLDRFQAEVLSLSFEEALLERLEPK